MKNIFELSKAQTDGWFSKNLDTINGSQVALRVMEEYTAEFHIHENSEEMFIVLNGSIFIDTESETVTLNKGDTYTVSPGIKHRARVVGRAELIVILGEIS
jgi:mannose-6-phosphate isomerase-like protein (cupin superfamily)